MALLNMCGFEVGDLSEIYTSSGNAAIEGTTVKTGSYACKIYPPTTMQASITFRGFDGYGRHATDLAVATSYVSMDFRVDTLPSDDSEDILAFYDGSALKMELRVTSAGNLQLYDASVSALGSASASALSTATWYRIDVTCGTGSGASYEVRVNGSAVISGTSSDIGSTGTARVYVGKYANRNNRAVVYYVDNFFWRDDAYVDTGAVILRMDPDGDGSATAWTIGSGSGSDWENLTELRTGTDSTYLVSTKTVNDASLVTLETTATAGISGTVAGVKSVYYLQRNTEELQNGTFLLRCRNGTTNADSSNGTSTSTLAAYQLIHNTDPNTSAAWTTGGLDTVELGVVEKETSNATAWYSVFLMVGFVASGKPYYYYAQL